MWQRLSVKNWDEMGLDLKKDITGAGMGVPGPVMPDGYVEVCVNLGLAGSEPAERVKQSLRRHSCKEWK